jgi:Uma2 family endonuclease
MSTPARALVSEAEFLALPESNQRIELLDGEVIVPPSPTYRHQEVLGSIVFELKRWGIASSADVTIAQSPLDVRFGPGRILQPDAMIFQGKLPSDAETPVELVPVVCIEVLSHNSVHDRVTKRYVYAEAGVQEYWIVDPVGVVERRSGADLRDIEVLQDRLRTPLLPGFTLEISRALAPP